MKGFLRSIPQVPKTLIPRDSSGSELGFNSSEVPKNVR